MDTVEVVDHLIEPLTQRAAHDMPEIDRNHFFFLAAKHYHQGD
jgi:hypothetical protein